MANAIAICTRCRAEVDKGMPEDDPRLEGQDDGGFVCANCAHEENERVNPEGIAANDAYVAPPPRANKPA